MRRVIFITVLIAFATLVFKYFQDQQKPVLEPPEFSTAQASYEGMGEFAPMVSVFSEHVTQISHLEITPDGQYMLVGTLPGTVWVYQKVDGIFRKQIEPFFEVKTAQPGWPPQEAGLTGIALGADFEKSGDVFLLYSFAFEKKSFRNRVTRVTFAKKGKRVIGTNPVQIFEANVPGTGSHQIQDGVGVIIRDDPHLLFTIGEGFVGQRAQSEKEEGGKVMIIRRNGNPSAGTRPWPFENQKVIALGIRNSPAIARNPKNGKIAIADTGPSNFDRFIYGTFFDPEGKSLLQKTNLNWDGTDESLQKSAQDLYDSNKEMVLYRWAPTETPVNIAFYENPKLSSLGQLQQYVLVTLFGRTGEPGNEPGKKILLGTIAHGAQNFVSFQPFIARTNEVADKLGHPIGLAVDPLRRDIYFGDIIEGRIYKAQLEGR